PFDAFLNCEDTKEFVAFPGLKKRAVNARGKQTYKPSSVPLR
ncbi:unnamed protein product, partial [marine sediment metagenome]